MERRVLIAISSVRSSCCTAGRRMFVKPAPKPGRSSRDYSVRPGQHEHPAGTAARRQAAPRIETRWRRTPHRRPRRGSGRRTAERDVRVETRDVIAVFTNRGARLKSWRLKHYFDQQKQPQELVEHELASQPLPVHPEDRRRCGRPRRSTARLYTVSGAPHGADRLRPSISASNTATAPAFTRSRNSSSSRRRTSSRFARRS